MSGLAPIPEEKREPPPVVFGHTTSRPGSDGSGSRAGRYQQRRNQEKKSAPAAPPAPERTRRMRRATPASGRSRRSWPNPPLTRERVFRRTTTRPPKQGLSFRPPSGYSSVRRLQFGEAFMWASRGAGVAGRPPTKD